MLWIISLSLCFQLLANARAMPAFSTAGIRFAFALPNVVSGKADLWVTTYEMQVNVVVYCPIKTMTADSKLSMKLFHLKRRESWRYSFESQNFMRYRGIYRAILLEASGPVRAVLDLRGPVSSEFIDLVPEKSCHKTYYAASLPGFPFIAVVSFNQITTIRVKFTSSTKYFKVTCNGDKPCTPNSEVTISLKKYSTWYFMLNGKDYETHNSIINADYPIYAISGNLMCSVVSGDVDICMSSIKPRYSWGKEYVLPHFQETGVSIKIILRINAENYPFWINRIQARKDSPIKTIFKVQGSQEVLNYEITAPNVFSSKNQFGLSLFYGFLLDTHLYLSMVQIIPTEQWTNGANRAFNTNPSHGELLDTFVASTTADVLIPKQQTQSNWDHIKLTSGTNYFYTRLLFNIKSSIYTKEPNGRLVVYVWSRYNSQHSSALRVVDFYQGVIYNPNCTVEDAVDGDGVDNDCDGFIDEEMMNEKDDDADGKVDEDNGLPVDKSTWTPWARCNVDPKHNARIRKIRSCKPSLFEDNCEGDNENCDPRPTCPTDSVEENRHLCECLEGCATCNLTTGKCTVCKYGFYSSEYCLTKCPRGWGGFGCSYYSRLANLSDPVNVSPTVNKTGSNDLNVKITEEKSDLSTAEIAIIVAVLVVLFIVFFLLFRERKSARTNKKDVAVEDDAVDYEEDSDEGNAEDNAEGNAEDNADGNAIDNAGDTTKDNK